MIGLLRQVEESWRDRIFFFFHPFSRNGYKEVICFIRDSILPELVSELQIKNDLTYRHPHVGGDPEITVSLWTPACAGVTAPFQDKRGKFFLGLNNRRGSDFFQRPNQRATSFAQ